MRLRLLYPAIIIPVFTLDQVTKLVIRNRFELHESVSVIEGFFRIVYIRNLGVVFGLLSDSSTVLRYHLHSIFAVLTLAVIACIVAKYPASKRVIHAGFGLVAGGALGNLLDRVVLGYVVDFLEFDLYFFRWPAFNVADAAITVGIALMALHLLWPDRIKEQPRSEG